MRTIRHTSQFKKDFKRSKRRKKDLGKLKHIIDLLAHEEPLAPRHRDHPLAGRLAGMRECHIEPDWLLIYTYTEPNDLILVRLGNHADLFKK